MTTATTIAPPISNSVDPEEVVVDDTVFVAARFGSRTTIAVPPFWFRVVGADRFTPFTVAETS